MEVVPYTQNSLLPQNFSLYPDNYSGSVQLLDKAGFNPFQTKSPLQSTLNQIFDQFVTQTGSSETSSQLEDEYLQKIGYGKKVQNLYQNLAQTFTAPKAGENAPIVNFLNEKINSISQAPALQSSLAGNTAKTALQSSTADANAAQKAETLKNKFYGQYFQLQKLLTFFNQGSSGTRVDVLA